MKYLSFLALCVACTPTPVKIGDMSDSPESDGFASSTFDDATQNPPPDAPSEAEGEEENDGPPDDSTDEPPVDETLPEWTIMVYLAGDNNLEEPALIDLNEMEIAGSTEDVNILVEIDRAEGYSRADGNWTGARRYLVEQDDDMNSIYSPPLVDLGEVDSGSTQAYIDFVNWSVDNFPAQKYALIIWNHGWGWTIAPVSGRKGVSSDDQSGNDISIANGEYEDILAAAVDATGNRLSMVGMDACLMGNWEIARLTAEYADVYVASQATESIAGWAFHTALTDLNDDPSMDALDLGATFAERFHETGDSTLSVVDLTQLIEIDPAINEFANSILAKADPQSSVRPLARDTQNFDGDPNDKDFRDFLERMADESNDDDIVDSAEELNDQLDAAIFANFTNGRRYRHATGLSIYIPTNGFDSSYRQGRWNEFTNWGAVVEAVR